MSQHFRRCVQQHASEGEIARLIWHMPTVARLAENKWAADFAKSVIGQARRRNWNPSPKQLSVMRELVNDLFSNAPDDDCEVVE